MTNKNVAIIHSTIECIDGVSFEIKKWANVLKKLDYNIHYITGKIGGGVEEPYLLDERLFFKDPSVRRLKRESFVHKLTNEEKKRLKKEIIGMAQPIKKEIKKFIKENNISTLIVENVLSLPLNLQFAWAVTDVIDELKLSCLIRHHDPFWYRKYFSRRQNNIPDIMERCFPPKLPNIVHVGINSAITQSLKKRGFDSVYMPNVVDFRNIQKIDAYNKDFRQNIGLKKDQLFFLQPTRLMKRKGIENSLKLIYFLRERIGKDIVLGITGPPVYKRASYFRKIKQMAKDLNITLFLMDNKIMYQRHMVEGEKIYSIGDAYIHADMVTFPSLLEGFGNPVVEACAYKKPLFVNKYEVLKKDFLPLGFDFITIDGDISNETIKEAFEVLSFEDKRKKMVEKNYKIAKANFSSSRLNKKLKEMMEISVKNNIKNNKK
jgi:glycosyltransferase involved in cell wall biosynthesis